MAGLGISWMQRYSLLSGTGSSSHKGSSNPAVGRSSPSSSQSAVGASGGVSLKVSHQQNLSQNDRPLGPFRVKCESSFLAVV